MTPMKRFLILLLLPLTCLAQPISNIFSNVQVLTNLDTHTMSFDGIPVFSIGSGNLNGTASFLGNNFYALTNLSGTIVTATNQFHVPFATASRVLLANAQQDATNVATTKIITGTGAAATGADITNAWNIFTGDGSLFVGGDGALHAQAGGGNVTTTSLTTGKLPKASGATAIADGDFAAWTNTANIFTAGTTKFLREDGTMQIPSGGAALANTVLSPGTATTANAVAVFSDTTGTNITQSSGVTTSGNTNLTATGYITGNYGLVPGSFTVANLWAISSPATGKILYCTDCYTPEGTGGMVYYDGSIWRLQGNGGSGIIATTTNRDYAMSWAQHSPVQRMTTTWESMVDGDSGGIGGNTSGNGYFAANEGASGTGASVTVLAPGSTNSIYRILALDVGTSTTGNAFVLPVSKGTAIQIQNLQFCYIEVGNYNTHVPDGTHVAWEFVGLSSATTAGTTCAGMLYDPTNVWTFNAGTLNNAEFVLANGAGVTNYAFSTAPVKVSSGTTATWDTYGMLFELGQATFFTNGVMFGSPVAIGNYYPTNTAVNVVFMAGSTTANAASTSFAFPRIHVHTRNRAAFPTVGTAY